MSSFGRAGAAMGTLLVLLTAVSCGSDKKTPVPVPPAGPSTVPTAPAVVRLEVNAPASIAPGASLQLTLIGVKSDNTTEDVTSQSSWTSSNTRVIEVTTTGLLRGKDRGVATIRARYKSLQSTWDALVLPDGTYRLAGRVVEKGAGVGGATVTVINGIGEGLKAVTDGSGAYALYGVSGYVLLQTKRDGYLNRVDELETVDRNTQLDIEMTLERPRADLSGSYTLTFTRTGCSGDVPERRTYQARVAQSGSTLVFTLSGADFVVTRGHGSSFAGVLDATGRMDFTINAGSTYYYYYYYYGQFDVVEKFTSNSVFIIDGRGTGTVSSNAIAGTLSGDFLLAQGVTAPFKRVLTRCTSSAHRFEMVRQSF